MEYVLFVPHINQEICFVYDLAIMKLVGSTLAVIQSKTGQMCRFGAWDVILILEKAAKGQMLIVNDIRKAEARGRFSCFT